jgi:hypothetical protein
MFREERGERRLEKAGQNRTAGSQPRGNTFKHHIDRNDGRKVTMSIHILKALHSALGTVLHGQAGPECVTIDPCQSLKLMPLRGCQFIKSPSSLYSALLFFFWCISMIIL